MAPEYSFLYAIPWILFFIIFIYLSWNEFKSENKIKYGLISSSFFLIIFGLRGFIGWDYANYYPSYVNDVAGLFENGSLIEKIENLEWDYGYSFFMIICKTFFPNYHVFIFVSTLIDVVVLYNFFKRYSINSSLSYLVFIIFSITLEVDTLRNIKALLLCLLAIHYIVERKPVNFFVIIIIATFVHFSAIFFLPTYFFVHKKPNQHLLWFLFVFGNLFLFFSGNFLSSFYENISPLLSGVFLEKGDSYIISGAFDKKYAISFGFVERTITWILLLSFSRVICENNVKNTIMFNYAIIYLTSFFILSNIQVVLMRVSLVFSFSYWIIYPILIEHIIVHKKGILRMGFLFYFLSYCTIRSVIKTSIMDKYENILFNTSTYEEKMSDTYNARINQDKTLSQ